MIRRPRRTLTAGLVCVALALAACGSDGASSPSGSTRAPSGSTGSTPATGGGDLPDSITLGAITSLTGAGAFCGQNERDGINLAVKQANEQGLLGDTEIKVTIEDDATAPETGLAAYQRLVSAGAPAIVGVCITGVAQAIAPLVDREGVPWIISTAAAAEVVVPEFAYRSGAPQQGYVGRAAEVLAGRGVTSLGIVYTNDNESIINLLDAVRPKLAELGIAVTVEEGVASTAQDFSAQIAQIKSAGPDAVAAFVFGGGNVTFVTQLRESGFDGPLYGHNGMAPPFFIENAGDAANGVVMALNFHPSFEYPSSRAFAAAFEAEYGRTADLTAANGYDATWRAILAISAAGSVDRDAIKAALDGLTEMEGAQGPVEFLDDGDAVAPGGVVEIVDGEIVGAPD